ncbi:MAG: hypothetical protein ACE5FA_10955, partial [Dehalococcoidia bacterium]
GADDEVFDAVSVRMSVTDLIRSGADLTYVELEGVTHTMRPAFVAPLSEAADWLEHSVWDDASGTPAQPGRY